MADSSMVIVIGASEEEFGHVRQCMAESLNDGGTAVSSKPGTSGLFVVDAQKNEKNTLAICEQLRNSPETLAVPILLVISRYEMTQGSAVKRMGNATFIIPPFKEEELREKIEQMKKESENHGSDGN